MAITREELRIGETYLSDEGHERTILGIGESHIFYKNGVFETTSNIDIFIKYHSIKPKPKKTIEIITASNEDGDIRECIAGSLLHKRLLSSQFGFKQISTRTIEIDE